MKKLLFDANPLASNNKSGVGYLTQRLIESLADLAPNELELTGHYFNFLRAKDVSAALSVRPNLHYKATVLIPTKVLNGLRRLGIELPFSWFARTSADVVLFPNFVSMPTGKGKINVVAVHDISFVDCPEYVSERNGSFLRRWVPVSVRRADIVLTISEFTKSRIMEVYNVPAEKIHVMHVPPAKPVRPDPNTLKKFGITSSYLLFVGTLEPRKNIQTLLSAYDQLPDSIRQKYTLVLVGGKGWKDEAIHTTITELQSKGRRIVWTGYATEAEKSALYENSVFCIQPSHYEGFGMPILEAMSYGKPVLCSDLPVFHEVAGDAATYFATSSVAALAEKILQLITNPDQLVELSDRATKKMISIPGWNDVAQDVYRRITR